MIQLFLACAPPATDSAVSSLGGPELAHTPPGSGLAGTEMSVAVTAADPDGVQKVELFHRRKGDSNWSLVPMSAGDDDLYTATVEGGDVENPAIEYYFKARDAGEHSAVSYLPAAAAEEPYVVDVTVQGLPFPFTEDFESSGGETLLSQLGWANSSQAFQDIDWGLTTLQAHGGTQSADHPAGIDGTPALDDWLISPPIDFSSVTTAQVTWRERGSNVTAASHGLYASTGSNQPADGAFVAVADLLPAPPEDDWARSAVYDLSAYAGQKSVYLAWRYQGQVADEWWIDDVAVTPLGADLFVDVTQGVIEPGTEGALTVTVQNVSALDASDVSVTLALPEGGGSFTSDTVSVGAIAGGASADAAFTVVVPAETGDNRYYPLDITVSSADVTVTFDDRLLVGLASVAHIEFTPTAEGEVGLVLGVGATDAPVWEMEVHDAVTAEPIVLDVDITDQFDLLPPVAGEQRWWLKVNSDSGGTLGTFSVSWDGVEQVSEYLPAIDDGEDAFAYVPDLPDLVLVYSESDPEELEPGAVGVGLNVSVRNEAAPTAGAVMATLTSTDPDVSITAGGPVDLGVLDSGGTGFVAGDFRFDLSAGHTDSSGISFDLLLDDGAETWTIPLTFEVPFPVLEITGITIDDDGGDGILDPGEHAEIEVQVTNVGDEGCIGAVTGVLSAEATSTAVVTVEANAENYSTLSRGQTREAGPFDVTVEGGVAGDTIDLLLSLDDAVRFYDARTQIVLGEPVWKTIDPLGDPVGDLVGDDFDFAGGTYRVVAGELQMRLTSATVFDPARLFIEAWGTSTAATYSYYIFVLQSGVVTMQGYNGDFVTLAPPVVTFPDATTVQFAVQVADMGLALDELTLGFGANWCGGDAAYCDHFPDGWGYPYTGWDTTVWYELEW